jgi:hypothetical protein
VALGLSCLILLCLILGCLILSLCLIPWSLYVASHAAQSELRDARRAAPCDWCVAADAGPYDPGAYPGAYPGAAPFRRSGPQHLMMLAPWPSFPRLTPQPIPKSRALLGVRSFALQFVQSCSISLVGGILALRLAGECYS